MAPLNTVGAITVLNPGPNSNPKTGLPENRRSPQITADHRRSQQITTDQ